MAAPPVAPATSTSTSISMAPTHGNDVSSMCRPSTPLSPRTTGRNGTPSTAATPSGSIPPPRNHAEDLGADPRRITRRPCRRALPRWLHRKHRRLQVRHRNLRHDVRLRTVNRTTRLQRRLQAKRLAVLQLPHLQKPGRLHPVRQHRQVTHTGRRPSAPSPLPLQELQKLRRIPRQPRKRPHRLPFPVQNHIVRNRYCLVRLLL